MGNLVIAQEGATVAQVKRWPAGLVIPGSSCA